MRYLTIITLLLSFFTSLSAQDSFSGYTVADEGAWCWFADPRALHYANKQKTIDATYLGYIDNHGSIKATQVNHLTGVVNEVLVRSWFQPDDHDNPSFLVLPDERVMIIYSRHTDEACFYYRISKRAGDITCLGEEKRLATANNTTYPNPYILSDDPDHIYMCWRGIGWHPTVAQMSMPDANDDIHFTWGPYQMVQSTGARPYAKYISNGKDKIYLAYTTGHPDNEYPNWLYCNIFDINTKTLYDIKGKPLSVVEEGKFALSKTEAYRSAHPLTVVDNTAERRDWIWNMALDRKGNPIIAMTKIDESKTKHEYYYAKWTGKAWQTTFIANGGGQFHQTPRVEMCYSGGMAVDRDNPRNVYCSVPVDGVHEIVCYTMSKDGKRVVSSTPVTRHSAKNNARPFVIDGTKKDAMRVAWMNGDYYYWIVNRRYPNAYPTSICVNRPLPTMAPRTTGFSVRCEVEIDPQHYTGDCITLGDITWGVNADQYSYLSIGGKTFTSQNVLGTADSWATDNPNTTDGKWYAKTKLPRFHLAFTSDGSHLTVYRNGIIDMQVEYTKTEVPRVTMGGNLLYSSYNTDVECLSQTEIKRLLSPSSISTNP